MSEKTDHTPQYHPTPAPNESLARDRAEMIRQGELDLVMHRASLTAAQSEEGEVPGELIAQQLECGNLAEAREIASKKQSQWGYSMNFVAIAEFTHLPDDIAAARGQALDYFSKRGLHSSGLVQIAELTGDVADIEALSKATETIFKRDIDRKSRSMYFDTNNNAASLANVYLENDQIAQARYVALRYCSSKAALAIASRTTSPADITHARNLLSQPYEQEFFTEVEADWSKIIADRARGYLRLGEITGSETDFADARRLCYSISRLPDAPDRDDRDRTDMSAEVAIDIVEATQAQPDLEYARDMIATASSDKSESALRLATITQKPADFALAERYCLENSGWSYTSSEIIKAELALGYSEQAASFLRNIEANQKDAFLGIGEYQHTEQSEAELAYRLEGYDAGYLGDMLYNRLLIARATGDTQTPEQIISELSVDPDRLEHVSVENAAASVGLLLEAGGERLIPLLLHYYSELRYHDYDKNTSNEVLLKIVEYYISIGQLDTAARFVGQIPEEGEWHYYQYENEEDFDGEPEPYLGDFTYKTKGYLMLARALMASESAPPTHSLAEVLGYDAQVTRAGADARRLVPVGDELEALGVYGATHAEDMHAETDLARYARLLLGASEVRKSLSHEQLVALKTQLRNEFRANFQGSENYDYRAIKFWSEALLSIEDPASIGLLLDTMRESLGSKKANRICERLLEAGNHKASEVALNIVYNEDEHWRLRYYFVSKLAKNGFVDAELPKTLLDLHSEGLHIGRGLELMSQIASKFNTQVDSDLLQWAVHSYGLMDVAKSGNDELYGKMLSAALADIESARGQLAAIPRGVLVATLGGDEKLARLYYLLNSGRSQYSLIKSYDSIKFAKVLEFSNQLSVASEVFERAPLVPPAAAARILAGQPPLPDLLWVEQLSAVSADLRAAARDQVNSVLGLQFGQVLADPAQPNFGQAVNATLDDNVSRTVTNLLGENIARLLAGEGREVQISELQKAKAGVISRLRQNAKTATTPELKAAWKDLVGATDTADIALLPLAALAIVKAQPDLALNPTGIVAEWSGHLLGMGNSLRAATVQKGERTRDLTIRYLDKHVDFIESFRFADAAQCCFTSANYTTEGFNAGSANWIARIARDPYFFVLQLEDSPPDARMRHCSGFVFGSYALLDGAPCLALNGVYLEAKTDAASNQIIRAIGERVAKPLGISKVVVASQYGGSFTPTDMISATGHSLLRPRAILANDNYSYDDDFYDDEGEEYGEPTQTLLESKIYDDLGGVVNQEVVLDSGAPLYIYTVS